MQSDLVRRIRDYIDAHPARWMTPEEQEELYWPKDGGMSVMQHIMSQSIRNKHE
jgi:hypothetical protein